MLKLNFQLQILKLLLPTILIVSGATILPEPVRANCPGSGRPVEVVDREVLQLWNSIKDDRSYFWGKPMLASIQNRRMTLTPDFDRLTSTEKIQVLGTLQLDGSSYEVYTDDGRLLSAQYDGCTTRKPLLTERDRYGWYLTRPPIQMPLPMLRDALRNSGQPSWRNVKVSIHPEDERQARFQFWQFVGYEQYKKGWWIGWVPEGGYFEITVANFDGLKQLKSFLEKSSQKYRYVIIAKDGTPLADTRYSRGNPWQWLLGKTSAPSYWQVKPCTGEAEFLCVSRTGKAIGSVRLQRWDIEKMPKFQKELATQGLTPGLITYANPNDRAKVLTAMKATIADYYQTIRANRLTTYGTRFGVMERQPEEATVGNLPGLVYGFSSVSKTKKVHERYVNYMAFDGAKYLYIIATSFDPTVATHKFETLADLDKFEPHLKLIVANLKLPHPDW